MSNFIKISNMGMIAFRGVAHIEKSSPDLPRLEFSQFIKISHKEMIGFRRVAQIGKSI